MFLPPIAFNLGPWEIGLIALLALLLFGGKRLPSLAKDLGSGIKEFRRSMSAAEEEETKTNPQQPPAKQVTVDEQEKIVPSKTNKKTNKS